MQNLFSVDNIPPEDREKTVVDIKKWIKECTREEVKLNCNELIKETERLQRLFLFYGYIDHIKERLDNLRYPDKNIYIQILVYRVKEKSAPYQTSLFSTADRPAPIKEDALIQCIEDTEKATEWLLADLKGTRETKEQPELFAALYTRYPSGGVLNDFKYLTPKNTTQDSTVNRRQKDGSLKQVTKKGRARVETIAPAMRADKEKQQLVIQDKAIRLEIAKNDKKDVVDFKTAPATIQRFLYHFLSVIYTTKNHTMLINYAEYAKLSGIDTKEAKKQVNEIVKFLYDYTIKHYAFDKKTERHQETGESRIIFSYNKKGKTAVEIKATPDFLEYVSKQKFFFSNRTAHLHINDRTHPHARHLLAKLEYQTHINQAKTGRKQALSVKKLLEACPDMEDWSSTPLKRRIESIIKPFERDLNSLQGVEWAYRDDEPVFIDRMIDFHIVNYEKLKPETIEKYKRKKKNNRKGAK